MGAPDELDVDYEMHQTGGKDRPNTAGAMLPGGYKIRAITEEDVTFDINKREVILSYTGSR